jgi:hypothetical protein
MKDRSLSPRGIANIFSIALGTHVGLYGSMLLFVEWPAALFVGFMVGLDRHAIRTPDREFWRFMCSFSIGLCIGGAPLWLVTASAFSTAYLPFFLLSPAICLLAGLGLGRGKYHASRLIDRIAAAY